MNEKISPLAAFREKHGLTIVQAAKLIETNHVSWSLWERGKQKVPKYILLAVERMDIKKSVGRLWD